MASAGSTRCSGGLIPFWAKDATIGRRLINARLDSVAAKPAFREALDAAALPDSRERLLRVERAERRPQAPAFHPSGRRAAARARGSCGSAGARRAASKLETCVIVTTDANAQLAPIHDRMPLLIPRARARALARSARAAWTTCRSSPSGRRRSRCMPVGFARQRSAQRRRDADRARRGSRLSVERAHSGTSRKRRPACASTAPVGSIDTSCGPSASRSPSTYLRPLMNTKRSRGCSLNACSSRRSGGNATPSAASAAALGSAALGRRLGAALGVASAGGVAPRRAVARRAAAAAARAASRRRRRATRRCAVARRADAGCGCGAAPAAAARRCARRSAAEAASSRRLRACSATTRRRARARRPRARRSRASAQRGSCAVRRRERHLREPGHRRALALVLGLAQCVEDERHVSGPRRATAYPGDRARPTSRSACARRRCRRP